MFWNFRRTPRWCVLTYRGGEGVVAVRPVGEAFGEFGADGIVENVEMTLEGKGQ